MGANLGDLREYIGEAALLISVVTSMLLVYRLPKITRLDLVLDYRAPTLLTAYASHFVHLRHEHLLTNLVVFGLLFALSYWLAAAAGRRRLFHAAALTFLLAFPLALSWLNLAVPRPRVGFGFSGVAMAFLGFLPIAVASVVEAEFPRSRALARAPGLYMLGLAVVAWRALPPVGLRPLLVAAILVAALAHLPRVPTADGASAGVRWLFEGSRGGLVLAGLAALVLVPFAAFPEEPVTANAVTNLYTHFLGYSLGFLVPYAAVSVAGRPEWQDESPAESRPPSRADGTPRVRGSHAD